MANEIGSCVAHFGKSLSACKLACRMDWSSVGDENFYILQYKYGDLKKIKIPQHSGCCGNKKYENEGAIE